MDTYEKKYKDALERAKSYYNNEESRIGMTPIDLEEIFPELKESWDERIKNDIKRAISVALDYSYFDEETADNCLAWIERQGKQKYTQRDVDDAYLKGICDAKQELEKQGEQILANSAQTCKIENYQEEGSEMKEMLDEQRIKKKALAAYWAANIQPGTTSANVYTLGYMQAVAELKAIFATSRNNQELKENIMNKFYINHEKRT